MPDEKAVVESNEDNEKSTNERCHSTKKKSSYRKDERRSRRSEDRKLRKSEDRKLRKSEERSRSRRRSRSSEKRRTDDRRSRRSEERRSRRSEEKRHRRSEERRSKRRHDRSPINSAHYRDSYGHYSPQYRNNRSMSPVPPRGPRTPPNTPPPNSTEFDEFRGSGGSGGGGGGGNQPEESMAMRHMSYGTPIMPPTAHYQPDLNHQYLTPMASSNMPNYMSEYAAYMHPNRMHTQHNAYNRPPPGIMSSSPGLMPYNGPNNEYYYNSSPAATHHASANHSHPQLNSFSNLIEVSPYGMPPNSSNVDCIRKQTESRRKPTIAVQKGNVLEIVPNADVPCDKSNETDETEKSDKANFINKQHQQALQRQNKERYKRKMERCQKRLDRNNRKKFLLNELERLSHLMIFGDDGKVAKAGEILKSLVFDGTTIKMANAKEEDDDDDDEKCEEIFIEPTIYSYDPRATVGRGILFERNSDKDSTAKRRSVLFADGIAPGNGTSASESDTDDNNINKPKKLSARAKNHKNQKNSSTSSTTLNEQTLQTPSPSSLAAAASTSSFHEKENILEAKVSFHSN